MCDPRLHSHLTFLRDWLEMIAGPLAKLRATGIQSQAMRSEIEAAGAENLQCSSDGAIDIRADIVHAEIDQLEGLLCAVGAKMLALNLDVHSDQSITNGSVLETSTSPACSSNPSSEVVDRLVDAGLERKYPWAQLALTSNRAEPYVGQSRPNISPLQSVLATELEAESILLRSWRRHVRAEQRHVTESSEQFKVHEDLGKPDRSTTDFSFIVDNSRSFHNLDVRQLGCTQQGQQHGHLEPHSDLRASRTGHRHPSFSHDPTWIRGERSYSASDLLGTRAPEVHRPPGGLGRSQSQAEPFSDLLRRAGLKR